MKHERTCLGCKRRGPKAELLRFVASAGQVSLDERQSLPGRGVYLHRALGCFRVFAEPGRWEWALRLGKGSVTRGSLSELFLQLRQPEDRFV